MKIKGNKVCKSLGSRLLVVGVCRYLREARVQTLGNCRTEGSRQKRGLCRLSERGSAGREEEKANRRRGKGGIGRDNTHKKFHGGGGSHLGPNPKDKVGVKEGDRDAGCMMSAWMGRALDLGPSLGAAPGSVLLG